MPGMNEAGTLETAWRPDKIPTVSSVGRLFEVVRFSVSASTR